MCASIGLRINNVCPLLFSWHSFFMNRLLLLHMSIGICRNHQCRWKEVDRVMEDVLIRRTNTGRMNIVRSDGMKKTDVFVKVGVTLHLVACEWSVIMRLHWDGCLCGSLYDINSRMKECKLCGKRRCSRNDSQRLGAWWWNETEKGEHVEETWREMEEIKVGREVRSMDI